MTTLPSPPITVLDVQNVKQFKATFVYNFFVPDEMVSYVAGVPPTQLKRSGESLDAQRIDHISKIIPRFVRIDFTPPFSQINESSTKNEFIRDPEHSGRSRSFTAASLVQKGQVQAEKDFSGQGFEPLDFQDETVDKKLFLIVSGSIAKRVTARNRTIQQQIDADRQQIIRQLGDQHSLMDAAKALADDTSGRVSNNLVVTALNNISSLNLQFIDDAGTKAMIDQAFAEVKEVNVGGQANVLVLDDIVNDLVNDPLSPFTNEAAFLQKSISSHSQRARQTNDPRVLKQSSFSPTLNAHSVQIVDAHDSTTQTLVVGFVIDKSEMLPDGSIRQHPSIVVTNPRATSTVDTNVIYGRTYIYAIRTVAELNTHAAATDSNNLVVASGLVTSRRSPRMTVHCIESVPPPPPSDFNVFWDYTSDAPMLLWSFPVDSQRDIKKFQVFRRSSVLDPFQLIKEFNFDDSKVPVPNPENPDPSLVEIIDSPNSSLIDLEFTRDSKFIYAVCSVDAHGFTSGYSLQLQVSFDRFANSIVKNLISVAGAPKSYPNLMLTQDIFVDTIKDSGHTSLRVYFDPEFLNVTDGRGHDLGLLATVSEGAKYKLQLINTDVQKQQSVEFTITDQRDVV